MNGYSRVIGWKLDRAERGELLKRFPPRYRDTIADHVTLKAGASSGDQLPDSVEGVIVGRADDGDSLECLVVAINGSTDRPDGSTFHITWSLDGSKGRRARESNDLLKEDGWKDLPEGLPVKLSAAWLR